MAAIKDINVQIVPGAPTLSRVGFGIPALGGTTGQRSVLISGSGVSGLVAKSVTRNATLSLEINVGAIFTYAFAAGVVTIEVPAGTLVRDLIADFNANAPSIVTDEIILESLTTGSGAVGLINPAQPLTFEEFRELRDPVQIQNFYDSSDPEFKILTNMFASRPSPASIFLIDLFGASPIVDRVILNDTGQWYLLLTNSLTEAEQQELSDFADSRSRVFFMVSDDAAILDTIQSRRTAIVIHDAPGDHPEASWAAKNLPSDPGSITWKWSTSLQGQTANATADLSALLNVRNKKGQSYVEANGVSFMDEGITTDPDAKTFIDQVRSQDFIEANLEADIQQLFFDADAAGEKIDYTTSGGIAQIVKVIRTRLTLSGTQGIIAAVETPDQAELSSDGQFRFKVDAPTRVEVVASNPSDITNRILRDVTFQYVESGAIHETTVTGRVVLTEG